MLTILSSFLAARSVHPTAPHPANPFLDPKHDPYNPLKYIASNALTAVAFSLILLVALIQSWFVKKWGAKWMLSMVIGAYTFALGLGVRFGLALHPESKGLYIVEYLFVVLSPCAFIAADYVLLGRLARHLNCDQYLLVSPRRITIVFISSDITTFLIQAAGDPYLFLQMHRTVLWPGPECVFLTGLAVQLLSFSVFTGIYLVFLYRVYTREPIIWIKDQAGSWYADWRTLAAALALSCLGILIRSGFRVVELSEGFQGRLTTSEAFFYGLDTLPLFIAISIYIPFWPGRFIPGPSPTTKNGEIVDMKGH
ncbi:RTA1 like protein-domain-containing protein [Infundibulicybe gibba]|nr:RTA1 like protein-domain-containing protein [Infundibulicybe gibba]